MLPLLISTKPLQYNHLRRAFRTPIPLPDEFTFSAIRLALETKLRNAVRFRVVSI